MPPTANPTYFLFALLAAIMLAIIWYAPGLDVTFVESAVQHIGPAAIVLLVAVGIVVSPIPSGVVALVAGALYGTAMGGALTVLGASLGASCAFAISRYLGRGVLVSSQLSIARTLTRERSQGALMLTIFVTRLIPFISFDAVSYVAGLTPLRYWRFLVATFSGTAPVCIAFAATGNTAASGDVHPAIFGIAVGMTVVVPACVIAVRTVRARGIASAE